MKFSNLIKTTTLIVSAFCLSFAMSSCEGDEGPAGPQGPVGATGATGATGAIGATGKSAMYQTGYFEGTISGTRQDGTAFTEDFRYEFSEEAYEGFYGDNSYSWIYRYEDASWESPYMEIRLNITDKGLETESITGDYIYGYFFQEVSPNTLFRFSVGSPEVEVTNLVYNNETGALSFDFSYTGTDNSTGNEATITGTYSTGEGKFYKNMIGRKG